MTKTHERFTWLWSWLQTHWVGIAIYGGTLLLAAGIRFSIYDRFLPYIDYSDEVVYVAMADHVRGLSDQTGLIELYGTLAPLYITFVQGALTIYDALKPHDWHLPAEYFSVLRLINATLSVVTVLLLVDTGRQLAGWLAGALAGFVWAVSPHLTEHDILALPDAPLFFLGALMLWATLRAWQARSYGWLFVSLLAGIAMIYVKIWIVTAVLPFLLVAAVFFWRDRWQARRWWAVYALVAGAGALGMLLQFDNLAISRASRSEIENLWDMGRIANNALHLFIPLLTNRASSWQLGVAGLVVGALAWGVARWLGLPRVPLAVLGVFAAYVLVSLPLSSFVSYVNIGSLWKIRHILPFSLAALLLWAAAWQQVAWTAQGLLRGRVRLVLPPLAFVLAIAPAAGWYAEQNALFVRKFAQPHVINRVTEWADVNLPIEGDSLVMMPSPGLTDSLWNRYWGAYDGSRPREWWNERIEMIYASSPQEYVARNIRYLILSSETIAYGESQASTTHDEFLARGDWQLVKTFAPVEGVYHGGNFMYNTEGTTVYVYRFGAFDLPLDALWGEQLRLVGIDWNGATHAAGDTLTLRFFWRRENAPSANYSVFVHLYPADRDDVLAQADGAPSQPQRPTLTWDDPDELYISEPFVLTLPSDLPSGDYRLAVGVYDYTTFARLTLPDGADYLSLPLTIR